ncbi:MAG TPA: exopolyphosphatase, partial [Asanoa sp.]|nr:exopolyphosphatase [Asanoa sp.]
AERVPQQAVDHTAVLPGGERVKIPPPPQTTPVQPKPRPTSPGNNDGDTTRAPLGTIVGARSGDKGGDANLGVWARTDEAADWLLGWLTEERLKELLPETAALTVERYELRNLRAVNFVIRGLLGAGVAASTRFDPQAKALGELLRARVAEVPAALVARGSAA